MHKAKNFGSDLAEKYRKTASFRKTLIPVPVWGKEPARFQYFIVMILKDLV